MSVIEAGSRSAESGTRSVTGVDVCICTYHRPAIVDTLRSLAQQHGCEGVTLRVIIADNALEPAARELIETAARELNLDAAYVHAPARNISVARNACLDAANAEWLALLDDDEIASPAWLSGLLTEAERGQWDAILGPVRAIYSPSAPAWIRDGNFHSTRPVFVRGRIETGYTGNVLIRRALIAREGLRFRTELGRSGGEDEDFSNRLRDAGGRIGFAQGALAYETIPADRTNCVGSSAAASAPDKLTAPACTRNPRTPPHEAARSSLPRRRRAPAVSPPRCICRWLSEGTAS